MANFKTHLSVAAGLSGALATGCLAVGLATPKDVWLYFTLGTLGGILPDIDANNSIPGRMLFSFFALVVAFCTLFSQAATYSIVELLFVWGVTYVGVRYVVFQLFARFSIHRGVFHSVTAVAFFGFLTTCLAYHLFDLNARDAWMAGLFVSAGYLIHLSLDEMYSIDLTGRRVKRSFGTALKLISPNLGATIGLVLATVLVFALTPSTDPLWQTVFSANTYKQFQGRLLPKAGWFGL